MHWFNNVAANDLAIAAVTCIGPLGIWLPFWFDHRQKTRDRRQRQIGELERLRDRIRVDIRPWANEWPEDSFNPEWYLPGWHVLAFEWRHVEEFNRLVLAGDFPREVTAGLVRLEGAARRFHEALEKQEKFRLKVPGAVMERLQPVYAAARARTSALSDEEVGELSGLNEEGCRWVRDLFEGNRKIHVEAIGIRAQDGLYETWRAAVEQIERVQAALQAGRDTWWYVWGHGFAGVLALTGMLFLIDLWWSFADDRLHRVPASAAVSAPASPAAETAPAQRDTSLSAPADTSRTAPPRRADSSSTTLAGRDTSGSASADTGASGKGKAKRSPP